MDYNEMIQLYNLLEKFEEYTRQCKQKEYDSNVLYEIAKTQNAITNIKQILSLEF